MEPLYAHSRADEGPEAWHGLLEHLAEVGTRARHCAARWGGGDWAYIAGQWHDFGKAAADWQAFLTEARVEAHVLGVEQPKPLDGRRRRGPDHSSAGAMHAASRWGSRSIPLQFAIAGHHAGLADWQDLKARLRDRIDRYEAARVALDPDSLVGQACPDLPPWVTSAPSDDDRKRRLEFFTRMTFSCLVDADFLDTEAFYQGVPQSRTLWPSLDRYLEPFEQAVAMIVEQAQRTPVNEWRRRVLEWCRERATGPRGAYTLTVPTGGGKTLASMAFALHHARRHAAPRIVVALPFISILDQTASVLRAIFDPALGTNVLLEHHSAIEPVRDTAANRLAAENWDAPLVVTTQVQLFESLLANRPSACRKLHSLAGSVIVLDEVQSLPVGLLAPILDVLQDLTTHYDATVLLTTATQPALHSRHLGTRLFKGLDPEPEEIVPTRDAEALFAAFRRTEVRWPPSNEPTTWEALSARLRFLPQFLAIVHRRQDAAELWEALRDQGIEEVLHLSALMCPAHRRDVLSEIRERLAAGAACRLVSTQVVEAGVDVDFPVVLRAMAGLEALAQSAGRCNREGRLLTGLFEVFNAPTEPPPLLRLGRNEAVLMLGEARAAGRELDLQAPATFRTYFRRLYAQRDTDARGIQVHRASLKFETTADAFRMVDSAGEPVFVPYGASGMRAIEALRHGGPSRERFRALQPYAVNVYPRQIDALVTSGGVETLHDSVYVLRDPALYDGALGLRVTPSTSEDWIA